MIKTVQLLKEIQREIIKESSKEDINVEKLIDLLCAYQILKPYQLYSDEEEFDISKSKLSDLDRKIISYIGSHDLTSLKNIFMYLHKTKSTVSYRIERMIEKGILVKEPTIFKDKPIHLTDLGKEVFSIIQKQDSDINKDSLVKAKKEI